MCHTPDLQGENVHCDASVLRLYCDGGEFVGWTFRGGGDLACLRRQISQLASGGKVKFFGNPEHQELGTLSCGIPIDVFWQTGPMPEGKMDPGSGCTTLSGSRQAPDSLCAAVNPGQ